MPDVLSTVQAPSRVVEPLQLRVWEGSPVSLQDLSIQGKEKAFTYQTFSSLSSNTTQQVKLGKKIINT